MDNRKSDEEADQPTNEKNAEGGFSLDKSYTWWLTLDKSYAWWLIRTILFGSGVLAALTIIGVVFDAISPYFNVDEAWYPSVLAPIVLGVLIFGVYLKLRLSKDDLREMYAASVFVLLTIPMFQVVLTGMDMYGFYALEPQVERYWPNTPLPVLMPYLPPLLANLILAVGAGLMFDALWREHYASQRGERRPYTRAAWVALPPLAVVYALVIMFWSPNTWIYVTSVFAVLAGVFTVLALLRDCEVSVSDSDRKVMLWITVAVIINLLVFGEATVLVLLYLDPSILGIPDHSIVFGYWGIDIDELGYSADEVKDRMRLGAVCAVIASVAYMVVVNGGQVIASIQRARGEDDDRAVTAEDAPASGAISG